MSGLFGLFSPLTPPAPLSPRRAKEGSLISLLRPGNAFTGMGPMALGCGLRAQTPATACGCFLSATVIFPRLCALEAVEGRRHLRTTCFPVSSQPRSGGRCRATAWEAAPTVSQGRSALPQSQPSPISPLPKARGQMRLPSFARRGERGAGGSEWGKNLPAGANKKVATYALTGTHPTPAGATHA
jgi:hypothetical protein